MYVKLLLVKKQQQLNLGQDMERLQTKGEAAEEELRALEMDMTGKVRA